MDLNVRGSSSRRDLHYTLSSGTGSSCVDQLDLYVRKLLLTIALQLDEAHNIKERATNTAKATFELDAKYRWCLSGTPLQNRVGELYSLVRFLGGDPFSYYFCECAHWHHLYVFVTVLQASNVTASPYTGASAINGHVTVS